MKYVEIKLNGNKVLFPLIKYADLLGGNYVPVIVYLRANTSSEGDISITERSSTKFRDGKLDMNNDNIFNYGYMDQIEKHLDGKQSMKALEVELGNRGYLRSINNYSGYTDVIVFITLVDYDDNTLRFASCRIDYSNVTEFVSSSPTNFGYILYTSATTDSWDTQDVGTALNKNTLTITEGADWNPETSITPPSTTDFYVTLNGKAFKCMEGTFNRETESGAFQIDIPNNQRFSVLTFVNAEELTLYNGEEFDYINDEYKITTRNTKNEEYLGTKYDSNVTSTSGATVNISAESPTTSLGIENIISFTYLLHFVKDNKDYVVLLSQNWGIYREHYFVDYNSGEVQYYWDESISVMQVLSNVINELDYGLIPDVNPLLDPYSNGGYSKSEGGNGKYDTKSDNVSITEIDSIANSFYYDGIINIYSVSLNELQKFAVWLYNQNNEGFTKIYSSAVEAVLSVSLFPFEPRNITRSNIVIGDRDTGIESAPCSLIQETLDFGEIEIKPFFNAKWDYSPYTSVQIVLPYVGVKELDVDEIMGRTVKLQYKVDILTGACVAFISVKDEDSGLYTVLYQLNGMIGSQVPLLSRDFASVKQAFIQTAGNFITGAVGGSVSGALIGARFGAPEVGVAAGAIIGGGTQLVQGAANIDAAKKPQVSRGGNLTGNNGFLGVQRPYLIFKIPRQNYAGDYQMQYGYPTNQLAKIGDLRGYAEIAAIHLENINATSEELVEIDRMLKEGVLL